MEAEIRRPGPRIRSFAGPSSNPCLCGRGVEGENCVLGARVELVPECSSPTPDPFSAPSAELSGGQSDRYATPSNRLISQSISIRSALSDFPNVSIAQPNQDRSSTIFAQPTNLQQIQVLSTLFFNRAGMAISVIIPHTPTTATATTAVYIPVILLEQVFRGNSNN